MELVFKIIFLVVWIAAEVIRFPHRQRNKRDRLQKRIAVNRVSPVEFILDMLAFLGMQVIPLLYVFFGWPASAGNDLPDFARWIGVLLFAGMLALLWRSHRDLGVNWSPTVELAQKHSLVTSGIYARLRHPIYAAMWVWCIAQALLLPNWVAGLSGLVLFAPVFFYRLPREEQMMIDQYGDEYRQYMTRTGGILPKM